MNLDEQLDFLGKGAVNLVERNDLKAKLQRGKPLTIKVGFDPTAPISSPRSRAGSRSPSRSDSIPPRRTSTSATPSSSAR